MKAPNFKILFKTMLCLFFLVSCSESETIEEVEQAIEEQEKCTITCEVGTVLNPETCACDEVVETCTKTCGDGEQLNTETCACEKEAQSADPFIITVDMSSAELKGSWKKKTEISNYTGDGYIVWEGANQYWKGADNIGKEGLLTFNIDVPRAGTYLFEWHSYIAKKAAEKPNTEHNDSWLRIPEADDFYGQRDASKVYPKGSGKSPNPEGENGNGFFKIYMNTLDKWVWGAYTYDNKPHKVYAVFKEAKTYKIEIAPRSSYHAIDAFRLTEQK